MNVRDTLLVALPAVLIGLGIGSQLDLFLGDAPDQIAASGPGPRTGLEEGVRPSGAEPAPLVPPSAGTKRSTAPAQPAVQAAKISAPELERALESVQAPEVAAAVGDGAIHGSVVDEDGAPVASVTIIASPRSMGANAGDPMDVGGGPPSDGSLKEHLQVSADSWARGRALRQRTTTGPDGAYALEGLDEDSLYGVSAFSAGYVVETGRRSSMVRPGQKVSFRAKRVYEIPVEIMTEDGSEPPADIVVLVERGNRSERFKLEGEQPMLRLVAGRVGITAYGGVHASTTYGNEVDSSHRSEKLSLEVLDNGSAPVQLVLKARGGVRGRVQDPWETASSHEVKALRLPADGNLDEKTLAKSPLKTRVSSGRYSLLDLTPGRYAIGIMARRSETLLVHEIVDISGQVIEVDLEVPEPDPSESLVVRAFGPRGRTLEDVSFNILQQRGSGSSSGGVETRRAPDGAYWITLGTRYGGFFEAWDADLSYTLTVQHGELGSRVIELEQGQHELEVRFAEPVSIVVVVSGVIGSEHEGKVRANVQRLKEGDTENSNAISRGRGRNDGALSPEGKARFDGLEPGLWKVGIMAGEDRWQSEMVVSREVRALSGEITVELAMPQLHSLTVHAPGLAVGTWLSLRAADKKSENTWRGGKNGNLDKDHRVVFTGLVAGQYMLNGNGVRDEQQVTVPGGEFFLDIKEPDCMRVSIGDLEGELYKAGLRQGDLIIGIDGKDVTNANQIWSLWRNAKGDSFPLTVLRGRSQLEFSMPVIEMSGNWFEKLGGMLTPTSRE